MNKYLCRFCQTELNHTFIDLGVTPLSNSYLTAERLNQMEPFFPLHVRICEKCYLVQLDAVEKPENIFKDYAYFSSYVQSWLDHVKNYTAMATERFGLNSDSKVVEVASNDGYLLQYFVEKGIPVLGIEPAENVAQVAIEKGIRSIVKFFGVETALQLASAGEKADLIIGNNVLAHVPNLNDFVAGLKILLKEKGVVTMEFPHLLQLIIGNQFDTIYHEHYSYFSFLTVEKVFAAHGLTLFDVDRLKTHGGSLRIYARHDEDSDKSITENVTNLRSLELSEGLDNLKTYEKFEENVKETKRALLEFLIQVKREGKTIAGFGAPAKGNTFLNYCGIGTDFIDYTVDDTPFKQGRFLPGTHIPIYAVSKLKETKPDYVLILPWNVRDEIIEKISYIRDWDAKMVIPIPRVEVV